MNNFETKSRENLPKLVLMVNDKSSCNIDCTHCYLPYEGVRSPENTLHLIKRFKSKFNIIIAGSEILTNTDYLSCFKEAEQKYILTNGLLLLQKPELFKKLKEDGIEEVRLSAHFGITKNLKSVPEKTIAKVVKMSKVEGFRTQLGVTITPENYRNILEMCEKAHTMNSDRIKFINYIKSGSAKKEKRETLNEKEIEYFFDSVQKSREKYKKEELEIIIHGNFGPKKGSKGENLSEHNKYCPAGESLFVIDPNNKVYGCPLLMNKSIGKLTSKLKLQISNTCNSDKTQCLAKN